MEGFWLLLKRMVGMLTIDLFIQMPIWLFVKAMFIILTLINKKNQIRWILFSTEILRT